MQKDWRDLTKIHQDFGGYAYFIEGKNSGELLPAAEGGGVDPLAYFFTLKAQRQLRKAVIPAAGLGTRMQSWAQGRPKEMLPIKGRPMISYVIREAAFSGVQELYVVVTARKNALRDYLESKALSRDIQSEEKRQEVPIPCLSFIEQPVPTGSGDAIYRARELIGGEPFALMMPDFILFGNTPALAQMIPLYERMECDVVGLLSVQGRGGEGFGNVGIVQGEEEEPGVVAVHFLSGKVPGQLILRRDEKVLKAAPRWILGPHFFTYLERNREEDGWDDTPAMQMLCEEERVLGKVLAGRGFDVGNPVGYERAMAFAAELDAGSER